MKSDVLDTLFGDRDVLSDMIIDLHPQTPAEKAQLQALMQRRDRVTAAINGVLESEFDIATAGLTDKIAALDQASAALQSAAKKVEAIGSAIAIVDNIVQVTADIIKLVAVAA